MNADDINLVNVRVQSLLNIQQQPAAFSQMISPVQPAWIVTGA